MVSKAQTLREQSVAELRAMVADLTKELVILKLRVGSGKSGNKVHRLGEIKKTIARIKTILSEKQREEGDR